MNYGFAVAFVFVFLFRYVFYVENSLISKRNLGFPIATLGKAYYSMGFGFKDSIGDAYGGAEFNTRTAVIDLVRNINSKGANIYVFMVESWSDSESSLHRLEKIVTNKFAGRALSVSSGSIPSVGGTIQGEYRELCGRYFSSSDINDFPYSECLPDFLIKHGYRTTSAHGYKSMFYLRKYLYKKIGFQRSIFFEDVHKKLKICKAAFVGICDEELLNYMLTNVRATGEFVYFLSLQSHEPVTSDLINETEAEDAPKAVLVARRFILTTLDALKLSRSNDCYSFVYFIGDHPPPSVLSTDSGITKVSFLRFELSGVGDCHTPKGIEGSAI